MRLADRLELSGGLLRAGLSRDDVRLGIFGRVSRAGVYGTIAGLVGHALRERPLSVPRIFQDRPELRSGRRLIDTALPPPRASALGSTL